MPTDPTNGPDTTDMTTRTRKDVIDTFYQSLDGIDIMGFCCEPIPAHLDPNDEQDGDTVCRVVFEKRHEKGKLFCAIFRVTFPMVDLRECTADRLKRNVAHFREAVLKFAADDAAPDVIIRAEDSPEHPNNRTTH